jgi:two-component system chemotaxis response regulator CheY
VAQKLGKLLIKNTRHNLVLALRSFPHAGKYSVYGTEVALPDLPMNRTASLNILLAEDEPAVAFSICFALKPGGHKIETVTDGHQALAKLSAQPRAFDLLITDNNMPRMTGLELVKHVRGSAFDCKILVLSAHLSRENRRAYEALGVDGMMPKPFDLFQLRQMIRRIVDGEAPPVSQEDDAFQARSTELGSLPRQALKEEDAPVEPDR